MSELKTKPNNASVLEFLNKIDKEEKKQDCFAILEMIERATGDKAIMWGDAIVGAGSYHYKYASGREGDWMLTGFSPRKNNISIYIMGYLENYTVYLKKLGKHKTGKACLYINKLSDVDAEVLYDLIYQSVEDMKSKSSEK